MQLCLAQCRSVFPCDKFHTVLIKCVVRRYSIIFGFMLPGDSAVGRLIQKRFIFSVWCAPLFLLHLSPTLCLFSFPELLKFCIFIFSCVCVISSLWKWRWSRGGVQDGQNEVLGPPEQGQRPAIASTKTRPGGESGGRCNAAPQVHNVFTRCCQLTYPRLTLYKTTLRCLLLFSLLDLLLVWNCV